MSVTSYGPVNTESAFLPTATVYPEENLNYALEQNYQRTANAVNVREVALYLNSNESLSGQLWEQNPTSPLFGISYSTRSTFRIVVDIPALALGLNVVPLPFTPTNTFFFTKILGGVANQPGLIWTPIPNEGIFVQIVGAAINITVTAAAVVGQSGKIILEYLKDN